MRHVARRRPAPAASADQHVLVKRPHSSTVIAFSDASVPIDVWPYGCAAVERDANMRSATAAGTSRSWIRRLKPQRAHAANVVRDRTAARSRFPPAAPAPARELRSASSGSTTVASAPTSDVETARRCARARSCMREGVGAPPLPSSSMSAVSAARPGASAGSAAMPTGRSSDEADDRQFAMLDRPEPQRGRRRRVFGDAREDGSPGSGPSAGQPRAIDWHHDHHRPGGIRPAPARPGPWARRSARRARSAASAPRRGAQRRRRQAPVAFEIGLRNSRDRR